MCQDRRPTSNRRAGGVDNAGDECDDAVMPDKATAAAAAAAALAERILGRPLVCHGERRDSSGSVNSLGVVELR